MRQIRSVGLATDLALAATRGTVLDRDDYLVVRTPDDPTYYFGNLLVLPFAPQIGEVAYWTRRFTAELGDDPAIRHIALRWDGTHGDAGAVDELAAAGFRVERTETMVARGVAPVTATDDLELRELAPAELTATAELEYAIGDRHDESFRRFLHRRARWKQQLASAGRARFYGAFDRGELVGSLGLVPLGARARYQDVQTAATHRRRQIASRLLHLAAQGAPEAELVIVAEADGIAAQVYRRAGFVTVEQQASALRVPAD